MAVGAFNTAMIPQDLAKKSFSAMITRLMPNGEAPLFGLTALLKEETAYQIEHGYFSKTMLFPQMKLSAAVAAADSVLNVLSTANVIPGMIFRSDTTNENILVTSVNSPTQVGVQRSIGTVAAAAIASTVDLWMVGNAYEESSLRPASLIIIPQRVTNNTQIFRNSWAVTKTAAAIPQIAGSGYVSESKQDCAALHAMAIEKALFFGQKFMGTRNGQPFHTMEGLVARVNAAASGNVTTLGATTNWTQFETALDKTLETVTDPKGGNIRTVFVGGTARRVIHNIARLNSTYQITTAETGWGLQIDTIRTPRGTFEMIEHPLFNAYGGASMWAKMAVIADLNAFSLAYLRKTSDAGYNAAGALVDNGVDAEGGTLTTELTCTIKNPAAFGVLYNFTAASAG